MRVRTRNIRALAAGLAVALSLATFGSAVAHSELIDSVPAAGAELATPPTAVRLTFSGALAPDSSIQVVDERLPVGHGGRDGGR